MELCTSTATLGNSIALHILDYLSTVQNPARGFTDLALEHVKLGKTLLDTRSILLAASAAQYGLSIDVPTIKQRLTQAKSSLNLFDHFIKKLVADEHKKGISKMSRGFRMLFADTDLTKYTTSLQLSRESLASAIGPHQPFTDDHGPALTVGYCALAAVLGYEERVDTPRSEPREQSFVSLPTYHPPVDSLIAKDSQKDSHSYIASHKDYAVRESSLPEEKPTQAVRVAPDPSMVARLVPTNRGPVTASIQAALVSAVSQKNHRLVEQLLDKGASPNSEALLIPCIAHHDLDTLRCLLMYGANPDTLDSAGISPLHAAVEVNFIDGLKLLLDYGANIDASAGPRHENALASAMSSGKTQLAHLLLKYCADPNCIMENGNTLLTSDSPMLDLLLLYGAEPNRKNRRGESPLFKAIIAGRMDLVSSLLENGADPNMPGPKHMLWPSVHHPQILEKLLEHGADLKRAPGVLELATSINSMEAVQILLKYGVDVNAKKDGIFTPLCTAIRDDRSELVDIILEAGADPNLPASEYPAFKCVTHHRSHLLPRLLHAGANPNSPPGIAEAAITADNIEALMLLVKHVDINARSSSGETALTRAIKMDRHVDLLLSYGADPVIRGHEWPIALAVKKPEILAKLLPHITTSKIPKGALEMAVVANQLESVKLLLAKGVGIEDKNGGVFSPLTTSIRENRKEIFEYLLVAGADPNSPGEHLPIIKAIRRHRDNDLSYIKALLARGADINLMYRGWNAVLQALENCDVKVLQLLVEWAVPDLTAQDESGRTVYEIIKERGLDEEQKILCRRTSEEEVAVATARLSRVVM